jgi:hypothetical protein
VASWSSLTTSSIARLQSLLVPAWLQSPVDLIFLFVVLALAVAGRVFDLSLVVAKSVSRLVLEGMQQPR